MAWVIEIIAAGVGLFLALSRMVGPAESKPISVFMSVQGALPFLAVMIIELTKIPLASIYYSTKIWRWKLLFLMSLILAMVITFETFFIGFEQYQSLLMRDLRSVTSSISEKNRTIRAASDEQSSTGNFDLKKGDAIDRQGKISKEINNKHDKIELSYKEEITLIKKRYEGSAEPINVRIRSIETDIKNLDDRLENRIKGLEQARKDAISSAFSSTENQEQKATEQLAELANEKEKIRIGAIKKIELINERYEPEIRNCFLFGCVGLKEARDKALEAARILETDQLSRIADQENKMRETLNSSPNDKTIHISEKFDEKIQNSQKKAEVRRQEFITKKAKLLQELAEKTGRISKSDAAKISELNNNIHENNVRRAAGLKDAAKRFTTQQINIQAGEGRLEAAKIKAAQARTELVLLCTELNQSVADNQVFRLAMQIHGVDDACDLTEEQLSFTKAIWFGSLAIIISCLGTVLALAAFVAKSPPRPLFDQKRSIARRLRLALIAIRRRMNKPKIVMEFVEVEKIVEVTIEIPVEKVAIKEVPVEVIHKEIVHVPIYTNDPILLGGNMKPHGSK